MESTKSSIRGILLLIMLVLSSTTFSSEEDSLPDDADRLSLPRDDSDEFRERLLDCERLDICKLKRYRLNNFSLLFIYRILITE